MHLSFAHLSDPHLPLPENVDWRQLCSKRFLGFQSWRRKRYKIHRPEVLDALLEDVQRKSPDHTIVSGDLTNIALEDEFARSQGWLRCVGKPQDVTVVPGNHDAYVKVPYSDGLTHWDPWMTGDNESAGTFPFVRERGPVAFVMLSTAIATPPFSAAGRLGQKQLTKLGNVLERLDQQGSFRVVVLHHPPEDHPTKPRKALRDRAAFRQLTAKYGAELVLHGHQHHSHFGSIGGPRGRIPVIGVPSASAALILRRNRVAQWNLFNVYEADAGWRLELEGRILTEKGFKTRGKWHLMIDKPALS